MFGIHNYSNFNKHFFGVEGALFNYPILKEKFIISISTIIWNQPDKQLFYTKDGAIGGMLKVKMESKFKNFSLYPYVEVSSKTNGWLAGNSYLVGNFVLDLGFIYLL